MAKGALTLKSNYVLPASAVPYGLCVSPDSKNAYIVLSSGSPVGIVQLAINQADGSLSQIGTQPLTLSNPGGRRAVVSPDGKHLYMTATGWDRLYAYSRSLADGSLTALSTAYYSSGVTYPEYAAVSPDGAHVYLTNNNSGGSSGNIQVYSRNSTTGALTLIQTLPQVGAVGVAVTPDGTGVFVSANTGSGTINGYTRDNNSGSGTYGQLTSSGSWPVDGQVPNAVGISTDSANVYVLSDSAPQYTSCFSRNASTNVLTNIGHPALSSSNGSGNWDIALLQDSPSSALYAAESDGQLIAQYTRNADGTLTGMTPLAVQTSNYGLASPKGGGSKGPYGLAVLPNNQYLYATALGTGSVDVFSIDQGANVINTGAGGVTVSGQPASVVTPSIVGCAAAAVAVAGLVAAILTPSVINCATATASVAGLGSGISATSMVPANTASVIASGMQANIVNPTVIGCLTASSSASGLPAYVGLGTGIICNPATVSANGLAASIVASSTINCGAAGSIAQGLPALISSTTRVDCAAAWIVAQGQAAIVDLVGPPLPVNPAMYYAHPGIGWNFPDMIAGDIDTLSYNFASMVPSGVSIASVVPNMVVHAGVDPDPETVVISGPTINGTVVSIQVHPTLAGVSYWPRVSATLSDGEKVTLPLHGEGSLTVDL